MSRRARREPPVAILTICTGNICRSPLAEQMLRQGLATDTRFEVGSAGLHAVVGAPMDPDAAVQLRAHGGDPSGLRGEQLTDGHANAADLLLTMTREQRDEVIRRHPTAMQRTFTLAEFAALLEKDPSSTNEQPRDRIAQAARSRAQVRLTRADDVRDPIDASTEVHEAVGNQIVALIDRIVPLLRNE